MLMNDDHNIDPMVAELLSQHALQSLDAAGAARLQRMLAEDPALAAEAEELCRVVDMLALSTQCTPPPQLRERVLASTRTAANSQPMLTPKVRAVAPRRWPMFASWSLAAAASLACAVLIVERQEQREEMAALREQAAQQTAQLNRQLEL